MPESPESPESPECTRCGYDLSGEVARWVEACPLESVCPECGRRFPSDELFATARTRRWFVESPTTRGLGVWRSFTTLFRVLWPRAFWRSDAPRMPVRVSRLLLWPIVMLIGLHLLHLTTALTRHWFDVREWCQGVPGSYPYWPGGEFNWELLLAPHFDAGETALSGKCERLWFPDHIAQGLALGSMAGAMTIWVLAKAGRWRAERPMLARAIIYGLTPLSFTYLFGMVWNVLCMLFERILEKASAGYYTTMHEVALCVRGFEIAWLAWWWYEAGSRIASARRGVLFAASVGLIAVLAAAIWPLGYWRYWFNGWW